MAKSPGGHRWTKFLGAGLGLAVILLWAPVDAVAKWKAVGPEPGPRRVRLEIADGALAGEQLRGIWTILEPGRSLIVPLTGEGRVRVQTRPEMRVEQGEETFRLSIALGDTTRRFRRRSTWEINVRLRPYPGGGVEPRVVSVGRSDEIDLDWTVGTADLAVTSREEQGRRLFVRILVEDGVRAQGGVRAGPGIIDLFLGVPRLGWDSNAFLTPKTSTGQASKPFLPLSLGAGWRGEVTSRLDLDARYSFVGRFYDTSVLNEQRHTLRAAATLRIGSQSPREGLDVIPGYRFRYKDDTFHGRGDREEFETIDPSTGEVVSLADRFDYTEHRGELMIIRYLVSAIRAVATGAVARRDYVEDFSAYPDIYSLDQNRTELDLALNWRSTRSLVITGAVSFLARDYDEKFSRDPDGNEVPDVPTRYRNLDLILTAQYGASSGLRAHVEIKRFQREDQFASYWDYSGTAVEGGLGWLWPQAHILVLSVRRSDKDYDNARVDFDPSQPLRTQNVLNVWLRGDYVISRAWEAIFRIHYKDVDNNVVEFAYERTTLILGLSYQY